MYVRDKTKDTFVLLQADWPTGKARQLIERLSPTHVIVRRVHPGYGDLYYLYDKAEALNRIAHAGDEMPLIDAFNLHEHDATPTVDTYADAEAAPERGVVLEEGRVVGFYDPKEPRVVERRPTRRRARATRGVRAKPGEPKQGGRKQPEPRSLVADFPDEVPLEETASLVVSLSAEPEALKKRGIIVPSLPTGSTIDVVVQPNRGFTLVGKGEGTLVLSAAEETLPLQFKLKATEVGPGKVQVLAFHQGQSLGALLLVPVVVPAGQAVEERRSSHEQRMARVTVRRPDLSLDIFERRNGGEMEFTLRLSAADPALGLNLTPFGPVKLRTNPLQYFQDFFEDIETLKLSSKQERAVAERHLAAKGSMLFDRILPADVQDLLWKHRDSIRTVQVQSDDPWVPWELMKLQGKENGRVVEGPFMCEAFAVTRWMIGIGFRPELKLKRMALVMPEDSGLPMAASERDYVLSLANGGRKVERIPAVPLDIINALAEGKYDGWHFTGHGGFGSRDPNRSTISLENHAELTPENLSGEVKNLGLAKPLIFLNACQVGQSAMSLTGIGGWAAQFLRAGAAAFIGAYWSVYDQPAHDFSQAFYKRLLAGMSIGKAVQEARAEIKPLGDPTWLAYTVFAHPQASVQ